MRGTDWMSCLWQPLILFIAQMADTNKLVTLIVLALVGLVAVVVGVLNIFFNRRDRATIDRYVADGKITQAEADNLTNPMWMWVLSVVQILMGVGLIVWGIFQYFVKVDDVV